MKDKELFIGLVTPGKGDESYFAAETIVINNLKKVENPDKEAIANAGHAIFKKLVKCIEKGLKPTSEEVQQIIKTHHDYAMQFHEATKKVYQALAQLYREHPAFRKQLDPFHSHLAEFMAKAMIVFAKASL